MKVLDASAILAWLFREPGGDSVARMIPDACASAVNLSEVLGRFARDGHDPTAVAKRIVACGVEIVPFGMDQAAAAAELVPAAASLGLSLGDRACLALARCRGLTAVTADRSWTRLDVGISIELVR